MRTLVLSLALWVPAAAICAETDAVAHPYKYIGFKNDGSGVFPNCTPPTVWDDASGKNMLWKTPMPSWTASSPIVVADRVFTLAEPNLLLCLDAKTGAVLWKAEADQTELLPAAEREKARALYREWHDRFFGALARAAELQVLKDRLLCLDGPLDKAFDGNFAVKPIEPALADEVVKRMKALPPAEVAAMRARVAELEPNIAPWTKSQFMVITWPGGPAAAEWNQAAKALAKYGYLFETWYGHMGHTFATPVSDGECVYASFGWGQVACYDLAGQRKWLKWFEPKSGAYLLYTNSPLLVGNKLIVIGGGTVRALDKKTGDPIWEKAYKPTTVSMGQNHAGSPICVRLGGVDLIVTSHGRIYQAEDGKVAAEGLPEMVASPAAHGDLLFMATGLVHGTEGKIRAYGCRLSRTGPESVKAERLWEAKLAGRAGMWTGPTYLDGLLYYSYPQNLLVLDAATGNLVANHVPNAFNYTGSHATNTVAAGGYVFAGNCWGRGLVLAAGKDGKPVACNQLRTDLYRDHALLPVAELEAKWWRRDLFPTWAFIEATPFFSGKRLYVRTYEYVYCIGQ